ncbi:MAG: GlsB/YeaQ/YmgE family stress response membrane protein [Chloroflexi bacterium]|nr:GlsB/YeaQ/YmgE family stress response membrane protein [Ktedonobacteraceae bacterium]MBV8821593.1 GlsB/YeaQ/YmgE family stress response membrane protein [Ktedonobacteraceae bacterium]MBV9021534.1 GlsB/YeaQ/YmgE family stress response membrane protein [Ktedonobacteraceae bacterium]MBV9705781.1 GlsB/YeaQ/YmgE family stress response membrane protein [Chloroflexota bacterium]
MDITLGALVVWIIIALLVGFLGELIAGRRAPDGIIGAAILGFIAIFLIVGVLHFSITGEPTIAGVPLISSIIAAALLVALWSAVAYHRLYRPYYNRYYRRGGYVRRPRRFRWF